MRGGRARITCGGAGGGGGGDRHAWRAGAHHLQRDRGGALIWLEQRGILREMLLDSSDSEPDLESGFGKCIGFGKCSHVESVGTM